MLINRLIQLEYSEESLVLVHGFVIISVYVRALAQCLVHFWHSSMLSGKGEVIYLKVCLTVTCDYFASKWQKRSMISQRTLPPLTPTHIPAFTFLPWRNMF